MGPSDKVAFFFQKKAARFYTLAAHDMEPARSVGGPVEA